MYNYLLSTALNGCTAAIFGFVLIMHHNYTYQDNSPRICFYYQKRLESRLGQVKHRFCNHGNDFVPH